MAVPASPTPNTALSAACELSAHHLCSGEPVLLPGSVTWRCRCLCHHAHATYWVATEQEAIAEVEYRAAYGPDLSADPLWTRYLDGDR